MRVRSAQRLSADVVGQPITRVWFHIGKDATSGGYLWHAGWRMWVSYAIQPSRLSVRKEDVLNAHVSGTTVVESGSDWQSHSLFIHQLRHRRMQQLQASVVSPRIPV